MRSSTSRHFWRYILILKYVQYIPTNDHVHLPHALKVVNNFAHEVIEQKTEEALAGKNKIHLLVGVQQASSAT